MRKSDFDYLLPRERIAQHPATSRTASRLLVVGAAEGAAYDRRFEDLPALLRAGDLLVFNDTRVIPARLYGVKETGGRVEVMVERVLDAQCALARLRASRAPSPGQALRLDAGVAVQVRERHGEFFELAFGGQLPVAELLERVGQLPLPPYIARAEEPGDRERYQTVYARFPGAVAAPTAGLHFDRALIVRLERSAVEIAYLTLHVGAGTFQPLRDEDIGTHRLHAEWCRIAPEVAARVNAARAAGRRVIAVGTTVVRALESAADDGTVRPFTGETEIFIRPGHRFRVVDAMLTNFHLPQSTLLMLVCAFGGTERVLAAYRHAVASDYRFYSYGDAMFLTGPPVHADARRADRRVSPGSRISYDAAMPPGHGDR